MSNVMGGGACSLAIIFLPLPLPRLLQGFGSKPDSLKEYPAVYQIELQFDLSPFL